MVYFHAIILIVLLSVIIYLSRLLSKAWDTINNQRSCITNLNDIIEEQARRRQSMHSTDEVAKIMEEADNQISIWRAKYYALVQKCGGTFTLPTKMDVNEFDKKNQAKRRKIFIRKD